MRILGTGITEGLLLKPIRYQWAMDLYDQAVANTWFPNEIQLGEDIADFKKMTDEERHAITFLMSYFNPNELLVNKALAFGVYPYINAPEAHLYLAKQMWEEANHCMSFEYVLETFPIDRNEAYNSHVDVPSMARKEEFEVKFIRRMTEQTLDITTTEGKQDFIRNLVAYNIILEGIWFYSGFMVALSFRQRNLLRNFGSLMDWVVRDESLHLKFGINLILTVLEENPDLQTEEFAAEIKQMILDAVEMEEQYNQRPPPRRHPRPQRHLHQPVRASSSPTAGSRSSASTRTTTCRTRPSGWRRRTTPCSWSTSSSRRTPRTSRTRRRARRPRRTNARRDCPRRSRRGSSCARADRQGRRCRTQAPRGRGLRRRAPPAR